MQPKQQQLIDIVDASLPQTQCTRCGYHDCHAYAQAIVTDNAPINLCSVGGKVSIEHIAQALNITDAPQTCQEPEHPRMLAQIDETQCVGCALCIQACPVDAIIGAKSKMHTVLTDWCNGCERCVSVCPLDCITLTNVSGELTGWDAWTTEQATLSKTRYQNKQSRLEKRAQTQILGDEQEQQALITRAFERARARAKAYGITSNKVKL